MFIIRRSIPHSPAGGSLKVFLQKSPFKNHTYRTIAQAGYSQSETFFTKFNMLVDEEQHTVGSTANVDTNNQEPATETEKPGNTMFVIVTKDLVSF